MECQACKAKILPKLTVKISVYNDLNDISKKDSKNSVPEFITESIDTIILYSPCFLYQNLIATITYEDEFDVILLRNKYSSMFWNCIWYFKLFNLPYEIILPHLKIEVVKKHKNELNLLNDTRKISSISFIREQSDEK